MAATRVDVRQFARPDFPQFGWLYVATEQAAAANAGLFRPAFAQALVEAWLWPRTPTRVYDHEEQPAWLFTALAFDAALYPAIGQLAESLMMAERAHLMLADEWAQPAWLFTAATPALRLRMLMGMGT